MTRNIDDRDELLLPRSVARAEARMAVAAELEDIFGEDDLMAFPQLPIQGSPSGLSALLTEQPEAAPAKPRARRLDKATAQLNALVAEHAAKHGAVQSAWKDAFSIEVLTVHFEGAERVGPGDQGKRAAIYERQPGEQTWSLRVGPEGAPQAFPADAPVVGPLAGCLRAAREVGRKVEFAEFDRHTSTFADMRQRTNPLAREVLHARWRAGRWRW